MPDLVDLTREAPLTAAVLRRRLAATGLAFLATNRASGFPRISGIEPFEHDGRLWLGSMTGSTKSADLRRDPRCALHTASADKDVADGDAKLWGVAVEAPEGSADRARYLDGMAAAGNGFDPAEAPGGGLDLWWLDLAGASALEVAGDHLRITAWVPGRPERTVERA